MQLQKRELIMHYMDIAGFPTIERDVADVHQKNGLMQLGLFISLLDALSDLDKHDREAFYETVRECQAFNLQGLYNRLPGCPDMSSHDDARGVVAGSKLLNLDFHKQVLRYGLQNRFCYNNVDPKKFSLQAWRLYRVDEVLFYFMANDHLKFLAPLLMTIIFFRAAFNGPWYYHLLDFQLIQSLSKTSFSWRLFRKIWMKFGCLGDSAYAYFKSENHAMVRLARQAEQKK